MSFRPIDGNPFTAVHDAFAFEGMDMHGVYECVSCSALASVLDIEFMCDKHWLFCPDCGTGIFKGIETVWCPTCHASQFFTTRKDAR